MQLSISEAFSYTYPAVVALKNWQDYKMYIVYVENPLAFLLRTIIQLRDGTHPNKELLADKDKLEFSIIETIGDYKLPLAKIHRAEMAKDTFKDLGFTFYNKTKPIHVKYKVDIEYIKDHPRVVGYVVASRNRKYPVGYFKAVGEAHQYFLNNTPQRWLYDADTFYQRELRQNAMARRL